MSERSVNIRFVGGAAPTHYCKQCGALWRWWPGVGWNLRSMEAGECCDNKVMGDQIEEMTHLEMAKPYLA